MYLVKALIKVASKGRPDILQKVIANWKETNRFFKESQLVYELTYNSS